MQLEFLLRPWNKVNANCSVNGLSNDSRDVKPGNLFLAYPGATTDGRLFIEKALVSGAVAIAYEPECLPNSCHLPRSVPVIAIPNLAHHLATIAARFYNYAQNTIQISGITGTNGKTTIAYQLAQAHVLLGQKAAYIGTLGQGEVNNLQNLNNTTPDGLCLQKLLNNYQQAEIKHVCMEVSSHALSLYRVNELIFTQAIFTNLTHDHLDFHKTMEDYAQAKAQLFAHPHLKYAIINYDDEYASHMQTVVSSQVQQLTYGLHEGADVRAINWNIDLTGTQLVVLSPWGVHNINLNALGKFNIYNGLAVFASLLASGYSAENIVAIMPKLKAAPGRMEIVAQKPSVIVDYAHTPDALENVLSTLHDLKQGRLWVVFGCGGDRDKTKRPMMAKAANLYADEMIITSDNPRTEDPDAILSDIIAGLNPVSKFTTIINREEAIHHALQHAAEDDVILIAGKGHESYQQIGNTRYDFSDQQVVQDFYIRL